MKRIAFYLCIVVAPALVSCASTRPVATLEPVGPAPAGVRGTEPAEKGILKVYSLKGVYNDEGVHYHPHTAYTVYSSDQPRPKQVQNARAPYDEEPVSLKLPPGRYEIEALAEGYVRVRVPVIIEAGRLTTLHLEASQRPALAQREAADWVRLPSGGVVGHRAELAAMDKQSPVDPLLRH